MKINYGAGETKLKGYINIDIEESVKPDLLLDIRKQPFPYENDSVDEITCIHNIEHIEYKYHETIFTEFHRVLKKDGRLFLAYPEFEICSKYFLENHKGLKDFWRATLYGRQLYPGDYHVTPMITRDLIWMLTDLGFVGIASNPEPMQEFNTFLVCFKGKKLRTHEDLVREEVFGD